MIKKQWKDILTIISGKDQKEVANPNGKYPIYGSGGPMGFADNYLCEAGTTIIGRKGTINKPIFVNERFWNIDTAFGLVAGPDLIPKYLYYFCEHFNFIPLDKSTGRPSLAKSDLLKIWMPVPSITEQERIIARIEELLSQLDTGVETLNRTKAQLAVYRQAILRELFSSNLATKTVEIRELVDDIRIGPFGTMLHKEDYVFDGVPVINPQHIKNNMIVANKNITVTKEKANELSSYAVQKNDIIMGRRGEMGRCAPVTEQEEGWLCGTGSILFRLKPCFNAELYSQILSSPDVVHYLEEHATGTTMKNLNEKIVSHTPVPFITREMEEKLIRNTDYQRSVCDSIEQTVNVVLQQTEAMRQSILRQAFDGGL